MASPPGGNRLAGLLMLTGGLAVLAYCLRHLWRAWRTGQVAGKLGTVYQAGEAAYATNLVLTLVGVGLALGCCWLGWRWWRGL
ncbi:hypothetical protein [Pseudorhodoferax soli]|nr:hypothetical protein [Pseudorhodoferax soli]